MVKSSIIMRLLCISFCAVALFLMASCNKKDNYILTEKQTEDLLFDYHLAEAMAQSQNLDTITARKYIDAVYRKHGITQAEFDSTMIYYMSRAHKLRTIYENLSTRMQNEARLQGVDSNTLANGVSIEGDTANIWTLDRTRLFMVNAPYNIMSFSFEADSTYEAGDRFILSFNTDFLYQDGARNGYAVLSLKLANDSVITRTASLSSSMRHTLDVKDTDNIGVKELRGFILHRQSNNVNERNSSSLRIMVVHDISLIKMHTEVVEKEATIRVDTIGENMVERLPENIEEQELKSIEAVSE